VTIDKKQVGLIKTLGTALKAVGEVCEEISETFEVKVPMRPATAAKMTPKQAVTKPAKLAAKKTPGRKRLLKKKARKANDADREAVIALRKQTDEKTWTAARDRLCRERGLTRQQVNGILTAADVGPSKAAPAKRIPKKPQREVNDLDRRAVINARKKATATQWDTDRNQICRTRGLTPNQVGGILGIEFRRKNGLRIGRPKNKVANKK